jgi:hypothetical protein
MQGDMGRVVFLFRNYSLNMQYRLVRDFRDGIWKNENISLEEREKARSRFLGILGMTTIFAGTTGLPLFWGLEAIVNNLFEEGDDDEGLEFNFLGNPDNPLDSKTYARRLVYDATEKYIAEGWGQTIATAVMKGPWSAFTGADLSNRASLNNLWFREIPENLKDDPVNLMKNLMGEALGPVIGGVPLNFAGGFSDLMNDHPDRALEKFMPKFISDGLKSIRYATKGAQTYQRDMILSPEQISNKNLFLQAIGFTPTRLADSYEQNRAIKDTEQKLTGRRQRLINRLFMAWRVGDRSEARDIFKAIAVWNKTNPRYPIMPDSIRQSAKSRADYDMRTVTGVAVDKRLQYLQKEMQFIRR